MAIPTFEKLFAPILELATRGPITRKQAHEAMVVHCKLTAEERDQMLPSGTMTSMRNRVGWAMTFLTKAALIEKVAPRTYKATAQGLAFHQAHPDGFLRVDLRKVPGYNEAWTTGGTAGEESAADSSGSVPDSDASGATPLEIIERQIAELQADVRGRLLQAILDQSPEFFEQLVLDVLVAMGYGGSREDAAKRLGRSGDEGIDGRINQDVLGLDQVLVQAKRYRPGVTVDRKEVQAFIGSLSGQGVTKGIFITTSTFVASAHEFVSRGSATKVILVDGSQLVDLLFRHNIGVRPRRQFTVHELDQNYFDEE